MPEELHRKHPHEKQTGSKASKGGRHTELLPAPPFRGFMKTSRHYYISPPAPAGQKGALSPAEKTEAAGDRLVRAGLGDAGLRDAGLRDGFPRKCQQARPPESGLRAPSRPPRPRAEPARSRGGGVGPNPPARSPRPLSRPLSGPGVTAPDSRRAPPRHSPSFVCECALGAEVPSTCVRPVPPGRSRRRAAPHKGDRGSGGRAAPGTGAPPTRPRRLGRGWRARGPPPTLRSAPARAPASGAPRESPLGGGGNYPDRLSGSGDVPPPPPHAELRSPADRPARQRAAPIGGTRGGLLSNHRARRARRRRASPTLRRPRDSAGPGRRRVRAGGQALRDAAARVEAPRRLFVLFAERPAPLMKAAGPALGEEGPPEPDSPNRGREGGLGGVAGTGRRAGRRARSAWREPPPRCSRAGGAGRGRKPSLNQFKTRGW
ncbi:basic salivary proline-rich protein 2-like [Dama dama]|uniref:basic salivary proline-rich protein 2-like n=1 Tax=Dama dama TaxID=30532 RepID=UPI002A36179A|nr:basic salivary proline-rich protein 2-like [Dama dama]